MKKRIFNVLCLAALCITAMTMSSCSKEGELKDEQSETTSVKPDNWESQLFPKNVLVCKPAGSLSGTQYFVLNYGIAVENKDKPFDSLFRSGNENEYYVEYEGKKYFIGDTVPIPGNTSPIRIEEIAERGGKNLLVTNFGPYNFKSEWINHAPIEYGYTFVWPAQNIRTHIEVYIKFNPNYLDESESLYATLNDGETGWVPAYWVGEWIDGKSVGNTFYHAYVIKR